MQNDTSVLAFPDSLFPVGCEVTMLVLGYEMWDQGAQSYVHTVGYVDAPSEYVCIWGNCLDANYTSRIAPPQNIARRVRLVKTITTTKTASGWTTPVVRSVDALICDINLPNKPQGYTEANPTNQPPDADFPHLVAVVRGADALMLPDAGQGLGVGVSKTQAAALNTSTPLSHLCSTVDQLRDRITLDALAAASIL